MNKLGPGYASNSTRGRFPLVLLQAPALWTFFALPASATGLSLGYIEDSPTCPSKPMTQEAYSAMVWDGDPQGIVYAIYRGHMARVCGLPNIWEDWLVVGISHDQLIDFVFDGDPLPPAQVPLPPTSFLLIAALWLLRRLKK